MKKAQVTLLKKNPQELNNLPDPEFFIPSSAKGGVLSDLPVNRLIPDPDQPRKEWTKAELDELESRIRPAGRIIQPVVCRPAPDKPGYWYIKDGEGRWRVGSQRMGFETIPAIIEIEQINDNPRQIFAEQILANIGRVEMTPLHLAQAIERWMNGFEPPKRTEDAAIQFGYHKSKISRLRKLLNAPVGVQELSITVTNLNTLNYLTELAGLDQSKYDDYLAKVAENKLPDAENKLRKLVQSLKMPEHKKEPARALDGDADKQTTFTYQSDENSGLSSTSSNSLDTKEDAKKGKARKAQNNTEDEEPVLKVGVENTWNESLLSRAENALEVREFKGAAENGNAVLELISSTGAVEIFKFNYEQQVMLVSLFNRCMEA